ncbi:unnamed protein product [Caenorhabditis nigoni]
MAKTTTEGSLVVGLLFWIVGITFSFCFIVAAVVVGIKLARRNQNVIIVNSSPASSPAVSRKAASRKSKKTSKMGGTSAKNSEPSKTEEEDPGVGA